MRKYVTEFGLNVYTPLKTLIPIELLDKFNGEGNYHIYMILSFDIVQGEGESEKYYNIKDFVFF